MNYFTCPCPSIPPAGASTTILLTRFAKRELGDGLVGFSPPKMYIFGTGLAKRMGLLVTIIFVRFYSVSWSKFTVALKTVLRDQSNPSLEFFYVGYA
jgi:hypothetical protein